MAHVKRPRKVQRPLDATGLCPFVVDDIVHMAHAVRIAPHHAMPKQTPARRGGQESVRPDQERSPPRGKLLQYLTGVVDLGGLQSEVDASAYAGADVVQPLLAFYIDGLCGWG